MTNTVNQEDIPEFNNLSDYVSFIEKNRVGACRHRTKAFLYRSLTNPLSRGQYTLQVNNELHSFIQILYNNTWYFLDLGGHPATLNEVVENNREKLNKKATDTQSIDEDIELEKEPEFSSFEKNDQPEQTLKSVEQVFDFSAKRKTKELINASFYLKEKMITQSKNLLVSFDKKNVNSFILETQNFCIENNIPFLYIDSPQDLILSNIKIEIQEDLSLLEKKETSGEILDFVNNYKNHSHPFILINANNFNAKEIIANNSILNNPRTFSAENIGEFTIPENFKFFVVTDLNNSENYSGADFLTRFEDIENYTYNPQPISLFENAQPKNPSHKIILNEINWESKLIGKYVKTNKTFKFIKSGFINALNNGMSIELIFAPINDINFLLFINKLIKTKTIFKDKFKNIFQITPKIYKGMEPEVSNIKKKTLSLDSSIDYVITPGNFSSAFENIRISGNDYFIEDGYLMGEKNSFTLYSPFNLPASLIAILNDFAARRKKHITLLTQPEEPLKIFSIKNVITNDFKSQIEKYEQQGYYVLGISEQSVDNLFGHFSKQEDVILFKEGYLTKILSKYDKVALVGSLNVGVEDKIAELLIKLNNKEIVCITKKPMQSIPNKEFLLDDSSVITEGLTARSKSDYEDFSTDIDTLRLNKILNSQKPIIFIGGETGSGKSYTIFNQLMKHKKVYFLDKIEDFLKDTEKEDKYLYIDEITMSHQDHLNWLGLILKHQEIPYNGNFYKITKHHKLIASGNDISVSDNRMIPELIKMYAEIILFKRIPTDYLIKKLSTNEEYILDKKAINILKNTYERGIKLLENSKITAITPFQFKYMFELTLIYLKINQEESPIKIAAYCAYNTIKKVLPLHLREDFHKIFLSDNQFIDPQTLNSVALNKDYFENLCKIHNIKDNSFLMLPEHQEFVQTLYNNVLIHNFTNSSIPAIVLEGESGLGKSELARECMKLFKVRHTAIPSSALKGHKDNLLKICSNSNTACIVDEFNTFSKLSEDLLNDLLSERRLFLVATQNNASLSKGKDHLSQALLRRSFLIESQEYSLESIIKIIKKNIDAHEAIVKKMALDFISQREKESTKPNIRSLQQKQLSKSSIEKFKIVIVEHFLKEVEKEDGVYDDLIPLLENFKINLNNFLPNLTDMIQLFPTRGQKAIFHVLEATKTNYFNVAPFSYRMQLLPNFTAQKYLIKNQQIRKNKRDDINQSNKSVKRQRCLK